MAAEKGDAEVFRELVRRGADPNMPDEGGNTLLHYLCEGALKECEFEFIKELVEDHGMRLIRNKEQRTAFNLIRSYPTKPIPNRGQPNFRRKVWDYF